METSNETDRLDHQQEIGTSLVDTRATLTPPMNFLFAPPEFGGRSLLETDVMKAKLANRLKRESNFLLIQIEYIRIDSSNIIVKV